MTNENPLVAETVSSSPAGFELTSPDVVHGKLALKHFLSAAPFNFGCTGDNVSPRLCWQGVPEGTDSFVLMVHDLDAPTGIGWMHWVVINIPKSVKELAQGVSADGTGLPPGALQTRTDFGAPGYNGPCPPELPEQPHRYVFSLYAIKGDFPHLDVNSMPALVAFHALSKSHGKATLEVKLNKGVR
jgi:Raf kinase inhibitor-like YbhB/YbcL family protein